MVGYLDHLRPSNESAHSCPMSVRVCTWRAPCSSEGTYTLAAGRPMSLAQEFRRVFCAQREVMETC